MRRIPGCSGHISRAARLPLALLGLLCIPGLLNAQTTCYQASASPAMIRGEGGTEQVADLQIVCSGSGGSANLQLYFSPTVPLTSKLLDATTGATEAKAITSGGSVRGVLTGGSSLLFTAIPVPAGTSTITVTNVRVDATALSVSAGIPVSVTEQAFISGTNITPGATPAVWTDWPATRPPP